MKLCMPAIVYLVLAVLSILMMILEKFQVVATLIKIIFVGFWTWILNLICSAGYEWLSWVLVLLPFIVMLIIMLVMVGTVSRVVAEKSLSSDRRH